MNEGDRIVREMFDRFAEANRRQGEEYDIAQAECRRKLAEIGEDK